MKITKVMKNIVLSNVLQCNLQISILLKNAKTWKTSYFYGGLKSIVKKRFE